MDSLPKEIFIDTFTLCDYTTIRAIKCVSSKCLGLIDNKFWNKYKDRIELLDVVREDIIELSEWFRLEYPDPLSLTKQVYDNRCRKLMVKYYEEGRLIGNPASLIEAFHGGTFNSKREIYRLLLSLFTLKDGYVCTPNGYCSVSDITDITSQISNPTEEKNCLILFDPFKFELTKWEKRKRKKIYEFKISDTRYITMLTCGDGDTRRIEYRSSCYDSKPRRNEDRIMKIKVSSLCIFILLFIFLHLLKGIICYLFAI